ncbi:AlbA family DNA-binding domain-containing protein [Archangium violaceum]|uniref:AlbA family DNA-binding domain-containing protein n=1 Tax=Archangium violaceum TaxID=83451 RepID=UPI0036D9BB35
MNTPDSSGIFTKITSRDTLPPISSSETDALDWKAMVADPPNRTEFAKDMAAFANASGGSIVIGVRQGRATETAEFKPLTQQAARSLARAYEEAARDLISPPPTVETAAIEIEKDGSGQWILAVNVSPTEAIFCAVAIKPSQSGETSWLIPKRVASQTRYLSPADAQLMTVNKLRSATQRTLSDRKLAKRPKPKGADTSLRGVHHERELLRYLPS